MTAATEALPRLIRILAVLNLGLMAGFFFAFANPTMPGLARTDGPVFVAAMQSINLAVRNLPFFIAFAGPAVLAALAVLAARPRWPWLMALLCYGGAILVTARLNIPINEAIALWDPAAPPADWAERRDAWMQANWLRFALTAAGFLAAVLGLPAGRLEARR